MDDNSSLYIDTFNAIEKWLRNRIDSPRRLDFPELVNTVADDNYSVRRNSSALKDLNKFRNFVVHEHSQTRGLAIPTDEAIRRIIAIRDELISPPSLLAMSASPVEQCAPTDPLGCCVKKMHEGQFSQLPIYESDNYIGLLTAETIARWLSAHFVGDGSGIVEEMVVSEVMQHQEDSENAGFLPRTATIPDAFAAFDSFLHRGKRLEAIILTHNGRPTESVLGIVTIHDIPRLNHAMDP